MTRAGFPLVSLLLLSGHNRARQRDKWAVVLEELSTLQEESEKLDQFLQTQWIKHVPGMPLVALTAVNVGVRASVPWWLPGGAGLPNQ